LFLSRFTHSYPAQQTPAGAFGSLIQLGGGYMTKKKFNFNKKSVWLLVLTLLLCLIPVAYVLAKTIEAQAAKTVFFYVTNADEKDILVKAAPIEEIEALSHPMPNGDNYGFSYTDNFPTTGYAEAQGFTTDELIEYLNSYLGNNFPEMGTLTFTGRDMMFFMADDSEGVWTRRYTAKSLNEVERKYVRGLYEGWMKYYEDVDEGDLKTWEVDDIKDLDPETKAYKEQAWVDGEVTPSVLSTLSNSGRVLMYHNETSEGIGGYVDDNNGVVRGCLRDALGTDKALTLYIPTSYEQFMKGERTASENFKWIYAIRLRMENLPAVKSKGTVSAATPSYELIEDGSKKMLRVTLTSPTDGATIYYNNGTDPMDHSAQTRYESPFTIDVTDRDLAADPVIYYTRTVREGYDDKGPQIMYYYKTAPSFQRDSGDGFLGEDIVFTGVDSVTAAEWGAWTADISNVTLQYPDGASKDLAAGQYQINNENKTITLGKELFATTGKHSLIVKAPNYATRTVEGLLKGMAPQLKIAAAYPMYKDIVLTFDDPTQAYQAEIEAAINGKSITEAYLDRSEPGRLTIKANYFATGALSEPGEYTLALTNPNYLPDRQTIKLTITPGTPGPEQEEPPCRNGFYLLADADDLFWFAEQVNVKGVADLKGRLTGDIDLDRAPWSPIGIDMNVVYSGTFDGDGYQISGLHINSEDFYQGLFGYVKYATIKNLTVSGQVNGTNYCTGGIAGIAMYSTIDNCVNMAAVQGTVNSGGIAGNASGSSVIQNCSNKGSIGGTQYAGGICGQATSTTYLQKCINYGQVDGDDRVGGITGANAGTKSGISLTLCVNKGAVSAHKNDVGGITGYAQKPVASCYNTGTILGKKSDTATGIGGIAGYVQKTKITNCYNTGSISCSADPAETRVGSVAGFWASNDSSKGNYYLKSGALNGIGHCASGETAPDATVSKTVDQMKALATTLGDAYAADTYQINGGYPVLSWQRPAVNRIAGDNRYDTSAKTALDAYRDGAGTVIIARGDDQGNFADALAASYLAGVEKAPILLTSTGSLPQEIEKAIKQLKTRKAYVLGGELAVSKAVENRLKSLGLQVERITGQTRYATAAAIAAKGGRTDTAIVVSGFAPADSLVAGPLAFSREYPILLVDKNSVPAETKKAIADLGIKNIIVIGGENAVSKTAYNELKAKERYSGQSRIETSLAVAEKSFTAAKDFSIVGYLKLADAVGAAISGNPIIYVKNDIADVEGYLKGALRSNTRFTIFGGPLAVGNTVQNKLNELLK